MTCPDRISPGAMPHPDEVTLRWVPITLRLPGILFSLSEKGSPSPAGTKVLFPAGLFSPADANGSIRRCAGLGHCISPFGRLSSHRRASHPGPTDSQIRRLPPARIGASAFRRAGALYVCIVRPTDAPNQPLFLRAWKLRKKFIVTSETAAARTNGVAPTDRLGPTSLSSNEIGDRRNAPRANCPWPEKSAAAILRRAF
jgi:hypothetical protein